MAEWYVNELHPDDPRIETLLLEEGIKKDKNLDYSCGITDEYGRLVATGSCFGSTLRCFAVHKSCRGMGLLNQIAAHLIEVEYARGNTHLFLYTKCESAPFFKDLGFHTIVRIESELVFMENTKKGFSSYLATLRSTPSYGRNAAAVVLNANPFTLGHKALVERACRENDIVHLFGVSEEKSLIPYPVRKQLILDGCRCFPNLIYHDSGPYIISSATFPSYFQKDDVSVIRGHALLDAAVFCEITRALGISKRYIGEEPKSLVTGIYNETLKKELPLHGITCVEIPRFQVNNMPVSASDARLAIRDGDFKRLQSLVPDTTFDYFTGEAAAPVIRAIQNASEVQHY